MVGKTEHIQIFNYLTVLLDEAGSLRGGGGGAAADEICRSQLTSDHGLKSVGAKLKTEFQPAFKSCLSSGETRASTHSPAACDLSGLKACPASLAGKEALKPGIRG